MFKIKLLILLFISLIFTACTSGNKISKNKFNINYISGDADGLMLSNLLKAYFKSMNIFDVNSSLTIDASISHSNSLFITNVDNTSDRDLISSDLEVTINDANKNCIVFTYHDVISQYYVLAPNVKFISNNSANDSIKQSNTENLVINLARKIRDKEFICLNDQ